jgi:23S rRNA (uracil1939-C5)-methyltransferase
MKKPKTAQLKIDKLVFGGEAIGRADGKVTFVWNALPGEDVEIEITKKKKTINHGVATHILTPSPDRIEPVEGHYLSCSPWSIMTPEAENRWKVDISKEAYIGIGKLPESIELGIVSLPQTNGYRNKMEFSFWHYDETNEVSLAFFARGKRYKTPIPSCVLAEPIINQTAEKLVAWLNTQNIKRHQLKAVILRSNGQGQAIAALFVIDDDPLANHPPLDENFKGLQIYYSHKQSPASVPTKLIYSEGDDHLIAELREIKLKYGLLSFFQINIPVFEKALETIAQYLNPAKEIVDFYSGVGAISLPLHKSFLKATLVDNNAEAIAYAKENIQLNNITNCEAILSETEKITDLIKSDKIIVFDPPRAGLHPDVIQKVLEELPERIIYLSCNISTHARDIELLRSKYEITYLKLFNFFPRTPHVESLCVLDKK